MSEHHEHSFLSDFQPLQFSGAKAGSVAAMLANAGMNLAALFLVFFLIGLALRLGMGL